MKREFLEGLGLEKETIDKIMAENGTDIEKQKQEVLKAKGDLKDIQDQLTTANSTIDELKKSTADNEVLQNQIKEYEMTIADLKTTSDTLKKSYALKEKLTGLGVNDPDYIIFKHGGVEKFTYDKNGELVGLEDTIKPYKESLPHVFITSDPEIKGAKAAESGSSDSGSGEQSPGAIFAQRINAQFAPPNTN